MELLQHTTLGPVAYKRWSETVARWSSTSAHGGLELAWATEKPLSYRLGSKEVVVPPGAMAIVPPGVEHRTSLGADARAEALHLGTSTVSRLEAELGPRLTWQALEPGTVHTSPALQRLGAQWSAAVASGTLDSARAESMSELLALEVMRARHRAQVLERLHDRRITEALVSLWDHAHEALDVAALARAAGMSRFAFTRAFEGKVGESPYRFLLLTRLHRARALLRTGRHSVTECASSAGFSDLSRFGQQFRRTFGQTPRQVLTEARAS